MYKPFNTVFCLFPPLQPSPLFVNLFTVTTFSHFKSEQRFLGGSSFSFLKQRLVTHTKSVTSGIKIAHLAVIKF